VSTDVLACGQHSIRGTHVPTTCMHKTKDIIKKEKTKRESIFLPRAFRSQLLYLRGGAWALLAINASQTLAAIDDTQRCDADERCLHVLFCISKEDAD
jgi:hypothetical protein